MEKLECTIVLRESLLIPVLMYGSETMVWKKERSRNSLRGLLGIREMDKVPNALIKEMCRVMKD